MISPDEISPDKVAVYVRWSTDDQSKGTTLETQLERCRHYVASQGWRYSEDLVYIDDGYSGGTLDRPAMTQMRQDVDDGKVECVVVYKIDRLSRSVIDTVDLVLNEWEGRCYIKSTSEAIDTTTATGKMFFYILSSFAEYERSVIKERTMSGKVRRAQEGRNPGFRPPFGYVKGATPGEFNVVDDEAGVVRRIFSSYVAGFGTAQIAATLNDESVLLRGRPWSQVTVRRLLANPAYVGVLAYGRTARRQKRGQASLSYVRFDEPRYATVEGAIPAIVDKPTWDTVQALMRYRSDALKALMTKPTYSDYLLSGLATCRCGAPIQGKRAGGHRYYYCSARKRFGRSSCDSGHIRADDVETEIESRVMSLLTTQGREALVSEVKAALNEKTDETRRALKSLQTQVGALDERTKRAEHDYRAGELSARLYAREVAAVEKDREALDRQVGETSALLASLDERASSTAVIEAAIDSLNDWTSRTVPERKALLAKLVGHVELWRSANGRDTIVSIEWVRLS